MFKIKKTDYIISAILLFLFLALVVSSYNTQSSDLKAIITAKNNIKTIDLSQNMEFVFAEIKVEIKNNSIRIVESDCPHRICVHSGAISRPGEIIVCVPNKVMIEIQGKDESGFDAVSY